MSASTRTRLRFIAAGAILSAWLGCATSALPEVIPNCTTQEAPGDNGEKDFPCPDSPGLSYLCVGSPSNTPLVDCDITDAPLNHFRTHCLAECPSTGGDR